MQISVILGHPDENSFNHAIADTVVKALEMNSHTVFYHDLYRERFDPLLHHDEFPRDADIPDFLKVYCEELMDSDGIVIIHPNWWGQPPAILKGWVDRVVRPGVAYEFLEGDKGEGVPRGMLKARAALVFNTSNTSEQRENEVFGDPLENIWNNCIFGLCGVRRFERRMFRIMATSTQEQRHQWLNQAEEAVCRHFPHENTLSR